MNPLLKKLQLKAGQRAVVLAAPESYAPIVREMEKSGVAVASALKGEFDFVQLFAIHKAKLEREATKLKKALAPKGILWVCYPKAKALDTDLNRDILHATLEEHGLDGVSIVSIDDVWSAMRFKVL